MKEEGEKGEGGMRAQIIKDAMIWAERLYPSGQAMVAGAAILEYARHFNTTPNQACGNGNWQCIGPTGLIPNITNCSGCGPGSSGTGQMHNLRFSPNYTTDNTLYGCSNWGGLWRSTNGGATWAALNTDTQLPFTSVSDIAIDSTNVNTLYISTGEAERSFGHYSVKHDGKPTVFTPLFTGGVYRSMNGGATWQNINGANQQLLDFFPDGGAIRRVRLDPSNPKRLFITSSEGIFKTDDASVASPVWVKLSANITDAEIKGLEFKPNAPQTMYASGRDIYRSTDGGTTWSSMTGGTTGLNLGSLSDNFVVRRINIAVSADNPAKVYAYITGKSTSCTAFGKLYIYVFNGTVWTKLHERCGTFAGDDAVPYRTAIAVSPTNENLIVFGTNDFWSNQSGIFQKISPYLAYNQFHADVLSLTFEPGTGVLFASTDGGVHKLPVLSSQWVDISVGLQLSTPYRFDDTEGRPDRIMMGNQDCGTNIYTAQNGWRHIMGGDGFNGKIDGISGIGYGQANGDDLMIYDFGLNNVDWESHGSLNPYDPSSLPDLLPALRRGTFDMFNHPQTEKMIFSMSELYERLKPKRLVGDGRDQLWKLRSDVGRIPGGGSIPLWQRQTLELAISESNPNYIFAAISGIIADHNPQSPEGSFNVQPRLFRSTTGGCDGMTGYNSGQCFTNITPNLIASGITATNYQAVYPNPDPNITIPVITGVVFDPEDHLTAWITFTGYEPNIKVWKTTDGGNTWQNADPTGSLYNLPVNDIVFQKGSNDGLYIATDAGVWFKDANMADWKKYCDFPNVRVMEIKINYCMGKIRAATFGRSVWEGDLAFSTADLGSAELIIASTPALAWTASRSLDKNLRIKKGATLTIQGSSASNSIDIGMPAKGKIIVEDGARLVITNANLTNGCGQTWQGIEVWGNRNKRQTTADQGSVVLTDVTLEHANNAITTWKVGDINTTGAIIQATRASFLNNRRSAEFLDYENTTATGAITDNASFYNECTFSITDQFRFSASFKQHATMWKVRGVKFTGCKFEYAKSGTPPPFHVEECSGIRTIDATPRVSAKCVNNTTSPCSSYIRSSFKGFNKGIYASATLGGYTIDITRTDFENNVLNIESDGLTVPSVRACTFKVGKTGAIASAPTFHEGLILRSETGFVVDENIFEPNFSTQTPGTIGIRTRNSGGQANVIYRNTFRKNTASNPNNFYGNLANQNNRSTSNPIVGLQYLCNSNQNNVLNGFDFAVADGNGISANQGTPTGAAMNVFSKGTTTPGSDFTNATPLINYYAPTSSGTTQYPDNVQTTASVLRYVSPGAGCPNQFDNPPAAAALAGRMASSLERKESAAALLRSKTDGGSTERWLERVKTFELGIWDEIRALSPFVSTDLFLALARDHAHWGVSNIVDLLKENPGAENDLLWEALSKTGLEVGDMDALRLELTDKKTERTAMQEVLNFWEIECQTTATLGLQLLLTDSTLTDLEQIRVRTAYRPGLHTEMLMTDLLLAQGKTEEASSYMNALPLKLDLSEKERREFHYFSEMKNLQFGWIKTGQMPQTLDENEVQMLQKIATESEGLAGDQARGVLNFFYEGGYFIPPVLPGKPIEERLKKGQHTERSDAPVVTARPNPSAGFVYFDCLLPENVHQGYITIFDTRGTPVKRISVRPNETAQWDTTVYPTGEYFYTFEAGGKRLATGLRIIVNK